MINYTIIITLAVMGPLSLSSRNVLTQLGPFNWVEAIIKMRHSSSFYTFRYHHTFDEILGT